MMRMKLSAVAGLVVMTLTVSSAYAANKAKLDERLEAAKTTLDEVMMTPDKGIPQEILSDATCVAVIPGFKKAAFVVGADYGQGVVTCKTNHGWSAPAFVQMTGGSFGFQIGGSSTDFVMIAVNDKGMQDLLKSKFKIGADAAAAAGPVGRNANAATNWKMQSELLTYSRSKGLFAGVSLDGNGVSQNQEDTRTFYGADIPFATILRGSTPVPDPAKAFVRTVAKYIVQSKKTN